MLKTIKKQFSQVVEYSQNIPNPKIDELFDNWLEAKRDIIEIFGGKYIYEFPEEITFHISEDSKSRRLENLVQYISDEYDYFELCDFIMTNRDSFYNNEVSFNYQYKDKIIPKGAKLIKSFKNFIKGKNALDDIQTRASQLIQEDVVSGKLCFSVHPLDYLSMSENTYNWRSCHALDGEYRAGNLSYMLDKSTIVCYLKGADGVKLPMFPDEVPWNSKKWRVLFYLSDDWDLIFAGRQYPFNSSFGLEESRIRLLKLMKKDPWYYCAWTDPVITEVPDSYDHRYDLNEDYILIRGELHKINNIVIDMPGSKHFNDVLHSSIYKPHYSIANNKPWYKMSFSKIHVGGECNCLRCGGAPIKLAESFMCDDCEYDFGDSENNSFTTCDCCGRRVYIEDTWEVDDDIVCENCVTNECFYCEECETVHYNSCRIYLEDEDRYVCTNCADNLNY